MVNPKLTGATAIALLGILADSNPGVAQPMLDFDTLASVTVTTDRSDYDLFEPFIATITVKNVSDRLQRYGPPSEIGGAFDMELIDPRGESVFFHGIHELPAEIDLSVMVSYQPGQSHTGEIVPLLMWPLWDTVGTYTLRVLSLPSSRNLVSEPSTGLPALELVASTTFDITSLVGVDGSVVDTVRHAADGVFSVNMETSVKGAIDTTLSLSGLPSSLAEFVRYLDAAYAEIEWILDLSVSDSSSAKYSAFATDFPGSVFSSAVEMGVIGVGNFNSSPSWFSLQSDLSFLRLKLLLQGDRIWASDSMSAGLVNRVPAGQPYNDPDLRHNYSGIELADATLSNPPGTDWILVHLVDTLATPDSVVARAASLLRSDGTTEAIFYDIPPGKYRVTVDHRNHLAIASDTLVDLTYGFATHDFTTGAALGHDESFWPQGVDTSGTDDVYFMFTGDFSGDCQITASDFNQWLVDTKAVRSGYFGSDFNMDGQSTASDFNFWLVNTKAVRSSYEGVCPTSLKSKARWSGSSSTAASKASSEPTVQAKLRITGSAAAGYLNARISATTSPPQSDTLGSFTFEVYYNNDQLIYSHLMNTQGLLDAGFHIEIYHGLNEHGTFVRVEARGPDSTYVIGSEYKLLRMRFWENNGPISSHDLGLNLASLGVSSLSDGIFEDYEEIVPIYDDVFSY